MPTCLHRLSMPRAWSLSGAPWIWFWCCSCWLPWPSLSSEAWCEQQHQKCWEMRLQRHSNRLTWRCSCPPCAGSYGLSTGGLLHLPSALWALPEGPRRLPPCYGDCCVSLLASDRQRSQHLIAAHWPVFKRAASLTSLLCCLSVRLIEKPFFIITAAMSKGPNVRRTFCPSVR